LHFTRGIQRTPLLASKQAQQLVERSLTSIMNVFSFQLEISRRVNAAFVAFHTRNTTHTTFSFETSTAARKTPPYVDNERIFFPVGDISTFKRCFVAFHTRNTTHTTFSIETSASDSKTVPIFGFEHNFFPVGDTSTFKRCFVAFHTRNTTHTTFSIETRVSDRKTAPFVDFDRNFFPVGDTSTLKRCFCCISHEEYNAHHF
jgi:hypothetical protein